MNDKLPQLIYDDLVPTRDYLKQVALVLSSLQRGFLPKHPRQWQYGLEVGLRGLSTQSFTVDDIPTRGSLDLVRHKVRLGDNKWALHEYTAPEIFNDIGVWLESHGAAVNLEEPDFTSGTMLYDTAQSETYAEVLWWMDARFRKLKTEFSEGVTSPILLYPHHFDLALAWFPFDDERQLSIGWSTGDETINESYVYLSAYPEPPGLKEIELPEGAYWHSNGFSGAVLPYAALQSSKQPLELFDNFSSPTLTVARKLFS